jgi:hypothetical protein
MAGQMAAINPILRKHTMSTVKLPTKSGTPYASFSQFYRPVGIKAVIAAITAGNTGNASAAEENAAQISAISNA